MSAPKLITIRGLAGKAEATYGGGGTLNLGTDGIWLMEDAVAALQYLFDGSRGVGPGTGGSLRRLTPKGRHFSVPFRVRGRGAGSAYSASVLPRDLDLFLRMSGHKRTITTTPGAEQVTYVPSSLRADWASGVFGGYSHEQLWTFIGAYCSMNWSIDGVGTWDFEFPTVGIVNGLPTDAALPAITYQDMTVLPPVTENMVFNIGSFQVPVIRSARFAMNRATGSPRANIVAPGGVAGFGLGRRAPTLEITMEKTALVGSPYHTTAGLNPYELRDRATLLSVQIQVGTTGAYNVIQQVQNQVQIVNVEEVDEDPAALWKLSCECHPSSPILDDEYTLALLR